MKKTYFLILVAFSLVFSSYADSKIRRFQNQVKKECGKESVPVLLLKKSLIELVKGEDCDAKFTSLVINKCSNLNCQRINQIYKEIEQVRSGSVVGDR